mmetsp:Transcript_36983/g.85426  ORF Transcript_36983/g.85426 Transcript_36983/m.85426 type:complete len:256 (+) Transcript_36983:691-1458(+)
MGRGEGARTVATVGTVRSGRRGGGGRSGEGRGRRRGKRRVERTDLCMAATGIRLTTTKKKMTMVSVRLRHSCTATATARPNTPTWGGSRPPTAGRGRADRHLGITASAARAPVKAPEVAARARTGLTSTLTSGRLTSERWDASTPTMVAWVVALMAVLVVVVVVVVMVIVVVVMGQSRGRTPRAPKRRRIRMARTRLVSTENGSRPTIRTRTRTARATRPPRLARRRPSLTQRTRARCASGPRAASTWPSSPLAL